MAKPQTYSDRTNRFLREIVSAEMRRRNENQRGMATSLGIAPQTLSSFLAGSVGAGQMLGMRIAALKNQSITDLIEAAEASDTAGEDQILATTDDAPTPMDALSLESSIFDVMDRRKYTPAMFDAVRRAAVACYASVDKRADFEALARSMLDAAVWLDEKNLASTPEAIFARVASYAYCSAKTKEEDDADVPF